MPTRPEQARAAATAARREAGSWIEVAEGVEALPDVDPGPREAEVVRFYDPSADLDRRASAWGHELPDHGLSALCRFAAGLAAAESEARLEGARDVATRAFTDRRFLAGDRVLHWAVPWLKAVAQIDPSADRMARLLLDIGDGLRPVPSAGGGEGLYPPGEDAFGTLEGPGAGATDSLWGGAVILSQSVRHGLTRDRAGLAAAYRMFSNEWLALAAAHGGTAGLWRDLAGRAAGTADALDGKA